MKKKEGKKGMQESLDFIIKRMATNGDIDDIRKEMATKDGLKELEVKIDKIDNKLSTFEKNEVDKRKLLEVRVTKLEALSH